MSKYEPLQRYLAQQAVRELPMTFKEIETVLGFELPDSARTHRPWWSNNVGSHVNAAAWRRAGWRTARVDLASEKVTFVRDLFPQDGVAETGAAWRRQDETIVLTEGALSRTAVRMIDDAAEQLNVDRTQAIAAILDACALERRRRLFESLPVASVPPGFDSTAIIRADRDGH
ncbi:MAG TPA: hypothetical protein VLI41_11350 [Phenylobacterium sp.]|nr:hypothetical protein [Phenylobacterium sp.]